MPGCNSGPGLTTIRLSLEYPLNPSRFDFVGKQSTLAKILKVMSAFPLLRRTVPMVLIALTAMVGPALAEALPPEQVEFFENKIRPVLVDRCYSCHSSTSEKIKGGLRVDTRDGLLKGGTTGSAIEPGQPDRSLLIQAVKGTARDLDQMPPKKEPLKPDEIAALEEWVRMGAPDPRSGPTPAVASAATHWAFLRPTDPKLPSPGTGAHPVDEFLRVRKSTAGLQPVGKADKRTLLRRATFDLTGLPPTPAELAAFLADSSSNAYAKVIDRLLASPKYGERWGRYWLDVARYADSKGYVFEQERRFSHSYTYRDWVVSALNRDLPYDQFLVQQIAGDKLATAQDPWPMAALGFLTLGRRFLDNTPDIIDDRIDVVFRGTQGLTVGCARCHDHKYDPIPTADYYSLYGVFDSSHEPAEKPLLGPNPDPTRTAQYEQERKNRQKKLDEFRAERIADVLKTLREHVGDYLAAAQDSLGLDWTNLESLARTRNLNPGLVAAWKTRLEQWRGVRNPVFAPWFALAALPTNDFAGAVPKVLEQLNSGTNLPPLNTAVVVALTNPVPANFREVSQRYGDLLTKVSREWLDAVAAAEKEHRPAPEKLDDPAREELRLLLESEHSPIREALADVDRFFDTPTGQKLRKLHRELDELDATHPGAPLRAMALVDNDNPSEPVIFKRGNPGNHGAAVKRQMPALLSGSERKPFSQGSGRLEMARAIASRDNPLTARVMVNRVWLRHFGSPLVRTPSDFGVRSDPPIHPEILDHLAVWFMDHDWSLKMLHRYLMMTEAYQAASDPGNAPGMIAAFEQNERLDPGNSLLWRMNRQRLDFEALRDSLLEVTGQLDHSLGGQPVEMFDGRESPRRSLYGFIDRQNLPGILRVFDFASPDVSSPMRFQTTVPQQALFLLNSPFIAHRAEGFVRHPELGALESPADRIKRMYLLAFQRPPTSQELDLGLQFIGGTQPPPPELPATAAWSYGTGKFDPASARVAQWTRLPRFTGKSWQWEEKLPSADGKWTHLHETGGHPGHSAADSAIRRWTAPSDGVVTISGHLNHPGDHGDGVLGRLVSSHSGELGAWDVFHRQQATDIARVEVHRGDTLDFIVEPKTDENTDSFEWAPSIRYLSEPGNNGPSTIRDWQARRDFSGPQEFPSGLSLWAQYAQVLLTANEFVFVD
jgi:Protein of unknown function (DUF1553)/Protein of unknown function (DUF1549)/Planctomycete cytochrome C